MAAVYEALSKMKAAFGARNGMALRFDAKGIPVEDAYVAWIDVMGSSSSMHGVLSDTAVIIGKFQAALLSALYSVKKSNPRSNDVTIHALTDGAFIVSHSAQRMKEMLEMALRNLARAFLESSGDQRFMVRSAVAYGKIVRGPTMCDRFSRNKDFDSQSIDTVRNVVLGSPFELAYHSESNAAPFGVYVDKTAIGREKFSDINIWRWWDFGSVAHVDFCKLFCRSVLDHLEMLRVNFYKYGVSAEKIAEYRTKSESYFLQSQK